MFSPFFNKPLLKSKEVKINNDVDMVQNLFVAAKDSDIVLRSLTIKGANVNITRPTVI